MKKLLFLSAFALFVAVGCKCNTQKCAAEGECTEAVAPACQHDHATCCDMEKPCCKAGEECKCRENGGKCECNCAEGKCCKKDCCKKECVKDGEGCQAQKECCKKECPKKEGACEQKACEK